MQPEGRVEVAIGTLSSGQGHETSFAQCVSEWLGVPFEQVRLIRATPTSCRSAAARIPAARCGWAAIVMGTCSNAIIEKAKRIAGHMLETDPDDVAFAEGRFTQRDIAPLDRPVRGRARGADANDLADDLRGPLAAECDEHFTDGGFPFGCAVCEVEIDPDTGAVEIVRYTAIDDVGRAVNPLILHGQTHGGIAQGVGQALWEHCIFDPDSGQLLAGSFMDYAMPRADVLPSFRTELSEVLSPTNPLGVRAGGEGGTTPALGVVVNAVVDALRTTA